MRRASERFEQWLSYKFPLPPHIRVFDDSGVLRVIEEGLAPIAIAHRDRARLYRVGIERRLHSLAKEYCFPEAFFDTPRVFVDVGANSGEFGILVERAGGQYIAVEPDPAALRALKVNVSSQEIYPVAVSDHEEIQQFFLKPETADSSLYPPEGFGGDSINVRVTTLDSLAIENNFPRTLDVVKIEAEGMEPEVIRGAQKVLRASKLCAVDAGPERGGESTAPEVISLLHAFKFTLLTYNPKRETFLFENQNLRPLE